MREDFLKCLPLEILSKIFSYLDGEDVIAYRVLSKYIYYAIQFTVFHDLTLPCEGWYGNSSIRYKLYNYGEIGYPWEDVSTWPRAVKCSCIPSTDYILKFLTVNSKKTLERVHLFENNSYHLCQTINMFRIKSVKVNDVATISSGIGSPDKVFQIELVGTLYSLRELQLVIPKKNPITLNCLQSMAEVAPNLEILDIYCFVIYDDMYRGSTVFQKLSSFKLTYHSVNYWYDLDEVSYCNAIESFTEKAPSLVNLGVVQRNSGDGKRTQLWGNSSKSKVLKSLSKLQVISFQNLDCTSLPDIEIGQLTEIYLSDNVHHIIGEHVNPMLLNNITTFAYYGYDIFHAMNYYRLGENLLKIIWRGGKPEYNVNFVNSIKRYSNLEELIILDMEVTTSYIIELANQLKNLKLLCFNHVTMDNDQLEHSHNSILDIYLCKQSQQEAIDWLSNLGYNVYNGRKNGFDINVTKLYEYEIWGPREEEVAGGDY